MVAAVLAAVGNAVVVLALPGALGLQPYDPLTLPPVVLFTVLGVVGTTVVYAALRRFAPRPDRTFVIVAGLVLVLSFVPDVTVAPDLPGATTASVVLLMVMHVVAAAVAVAVLTGGVTDRV